MKRGDWRELIDTLRGAEYQFGLITADSPVHRVEFAPGLSDAEVDTVEGRFGFGFPPDLRAFLQTALPQGPRFPDWRDGDEVALREWLDQPREGVLFDVEHNRFWLPEWGERPGSLKEALERAGNLVDAAPRLIPIYGHRMMPDEPRLASNPVFSVVQTDIIHYGHDLADYLLHEFDLPRRASRTEPPRAIRFWDEERFQGTRWGADGSCRFDNRRGELP